MTDSRSGEENSQDDPRTTSHNKTQRKMIQSCKYKEVITGQEETVTCCYPRVYFKYIKSYSLVITGEC